jgi:hypothetical protein
MGENLAFRGMLLKMMKRFPVYPILFAIYPVLNLYAQNVSQVTPVTLLRPLIASMIFTFVIWALVGLFVRSWQKSALIVLVIQAAFFTFGHLLGFLKAITVFGRTIPPGVYLGVGEIILLVVLFRSILLAKKRFNQLGTYLNIVTIFLVVFPFLRIGQYYWDQHQFAQQVSTQAAAINSSANKPDVYMIVLDAYSRQDLLKADFGFDNSAFINQLQGMGFDVLPCSRSNYNGTEVSLASMLNMAYLSDLGIDGVTINSGSNPEMPFVKNNQVRNIFEQMGYNVYAFQTEFPTLDWEQTTRLFAPPQTSTLSQALLPIETLFIKSTALDLLMNLPVPWSNQLNEKINSAYSDHVRNVRYTLTTLPGTATLPGPKLVYAHIVAPHKPFIFDAQGNIITDTRFYQDNGDAINPDFYKKGYIGQTEFINSQIVPILKDILRYSQKPPIIILMGDHGYQVKDTHFENLLALYMPDHKDSALYPSMSLVNVYRTIFDQYFGQSYPLLPDHSYHIDLQKGYIPAPETQPGCIKP